MSVLAQRSNIVYTSPTYMHINITETQSGDAEDDVKLVAKQEFEGDNAPPPVFLTFDLATMPDSDKPQDDDCWKRDNLRIQVMAELELKEDKKDKKQTYRFEFGPGQVHNQDNRYTLEKHVKYTYKQQASAPTPAPTAAKKAKGFKTIGLRKPQPGSKEKSINVDMCFQIVFDIGDDAVFRSILHKNQVTAQNEAI